MLLPVIPENPKNKRGYYRVGNVDTYSKLEAFKLAHATKQQVEYIFNDDVYSSCDWTKEPTASIDELYRQRAEQLRQKYDYIVLLYSGGADSHNMLMTFLTNNIHIDEIMQYVHQEGPGSSTDFGNSEINLVAYPTTQKLLNEYKVKGTKHRVVDYTKTVVDLPNLLTEDDIMYRARRWLSPNSIARGFITETFPEYKKMSQEGKKICFVWAIDKPCISGLFDPVTEKYHYAAMFPERGAGIGMELNFETESWKTDELFYWTPDLPEIVIKQCHMLINYVKTQPLDSSAFSAYQKRLPGTTIMEQYTVGHIKSENKFKFLHIDHAHRVLYRYWNIDTYTAGKSFSGIINHRDHWIWRNKNQFKVADLFLSVAKKMQNMPGWNGINNGMKDVHSRFYPLESIGPLSNYQKYIFC